MASPWVSPQRYPDERPWLGMAMLVALPLLSLVLVRMLWSGSSLWFLTAGLILLGAAAVIFLARRPQELEYGRETLARETNRLPLVLMGLGVVFMAMLLLPNFAGGGGSSSSGALVEQQQPIAPAAGALSEVSGVSQPPAPPPAIEEQEAAPSADGSQVYVVASGDTLWDIAARFSSTVDAIVEANGLANAADIAIDQELIIPAATEDPFTGTFVPEEEVLPVALDGEVSDEPTE